MKNLTVNQIIVLLEIYRGTMNQDNVDTTYRTDIPVLIKAGLINSDITKDEMTPKGIKLVEKIKDVCKLEEIKMDSHVK